MFEFFKIQVFFRTSVFYLVNVVQQNMIYDKGERGSDFFWHVGEGGLDRSNFGGHHVSAAPYGLRVFTFDDEMGMYQL